MELAVYETHRAFPFQLPLGSNCRLWSEAGWALHGDFFTAAKGSLSGIGVASWGWGERSAAGSTPSTSCHWAISGPGCLPVHSQWSKILGNFPPSHEVPRQGECLMQQHQYKDKSTKKELRNSFGFHVGPTHSCRGNPWPTVCIQVCPRLAQLPRIQQYNQTKCPSTSWACSRKPLPQRTGSTSSGSNPVETAWPQ